MKNFTLIVILLFIFGGSSCEPSSDSYAESRNEKIRPSILDENNLTKPNENRCDGNWQKLFLPNLLEFQRASFIKPISTSFFASGTKEIRVWVGFGNISLRGFILQKLPARPVNATYLVEQNGSKRLIKRNLENSGGRNDLVFAELEQLGGFSIPDQCENSAPELAEEDADVVIIETINNGEKRSIKYSGIPLSHQEHAVLVRSICETLERRYEINLLR